MGLRITKEITNTKSMRCSILATAIGAICLAAPALAAEQSMGGIDVRADVFEALLLERRLMYSGNVVATQGVYTIQADTMEILLNKDNEVISVKAQGNPAVVVDNEQEPPVILKGLTIDYDLDNSSVKATGTAAFRRGRDTMVSEWVNYSLVQQKALAGHSKDEQVHITFFQNNQQNK